MQGGARLVKHDKGKGFTAEKDDYVLAEGPGGERVWIHKRTGAIRKSKPSELRKTAPDRGAEIIKDEKEPGFRAEKKDYVLAESPTGERVWIHKRTGEIRTTLPPDGRTEKKVPEISAQTAPEVGRDAPVSDQAHEDVEMTSSSTATAERLLSLVPAVSPAVSPTNGGLGVPADSSAAAAAMSSAWFGTTAGATTEDVKHADELRPADIRSLPAAKDGLGDIPKTLPGGPEETGPLAGINFEVVPDILCAADYDLFAGSLSAEDYNDIMSKDVAERAGQAVEAAATAAAAAAIVAAPAAMAGLVGLGAGSTGADPGSLLSNTEVLDASGVLLSDIDPADMPVESLEAAMAAQMMQLNRFYLQQRVFETQRSMAAGEMPTRFKEGFRPMQLCKQFVKTASCVRGDTCSYAHNQEELHPMSPELPGATSTKAVEAIAEDSGVKDDIPEPSMRMQRKRAMCQRMTRGGCLLGKKCPFAHSEAELGTVALAITDRVKTQICKFWEQNKCVYAKYCVNAHGMEEIGKPKPDYLCPPAKQNKKE